MNLRFDIIGDATKPIIRYNKMRLLFDTGAETPVWCVGKKMFCKTFPYATRQTFRYLLSGFGRTEQELKKFMLNPTEEVAKDFLADVYSIPSFCLSVGEHTITWKNLKVAVTVKEGIGADLILSSTMFRGMNLQWNQEDVTKPYIEIESLNSVKYVFVQQSEKQFYGRELLKYIYAQDSMEIENIKIEEQSELDDLNAFIDL